MGSFSFLLIMVLLNLAVAVLCADKYSRYDFPPGFVFGSATSAYQVEGAANEDGGHLAFRILLLMQISGYANGATGDVAVDQYHKYKEDVQLMAEIGLDAYRFSISWSRLIPNGRGPVNPKGLQYYNNLINELVSRGIQPHVTLHNYDLPQALEDEYGGWINPRIVKDFTTYADVCFREFGDRVSYWTTVNEPDVFAVGGYDGGFVPPRHCSPPFGMNCTRGNSSFEPYAAVHNILLAHASAARLYQKKYQGKQHGFIGISVYTTCNFALTNSAEDVIATQRANDFFIGWIVKPLVFGDYPDTMKKIAGSRIPAFTNHESELVRYREFFIDLSVLEYFKEVYGNPPIYILENGQRIRRNLTLEDTSRVNYLRAYIGSVLDAVRNGSNTRGYFVWSFLDVFELLDGHESSYGFYYVDLEDPDLKRFPKLSAHWYSHFLKG